MRGLFIPEITAEMFKNGCLESIESLMAEGKIYDIDYPLEQEHCDNAISGQAVLDAISRIGLHKSDTKEVHVVTECLRTVEASPPVTPQPKTGHWIVDREAFRLNAHGEQTFDYSVHCDKCDYRCDYTTDVKGSSPSKFCPNCGAKMESGEYANEWIGYSR